MKFNFTTLRDSAELQLNTMLGGEPPDVQTGADAIVVAAALFDWIALNVPATRHQEVAEHVVKALNPETT